MGNSNGKPVVFTDEGGRSDIPCSATYRGWGWDTSRLPVFSPSRLCLQSRTVADSSFTITVNLNHFRLLRVVGKGAFGKVRIVERKDTGLTFALKYIRKDEGRIPSKLYIYTLSKNTSSHF